MFRAHHLVVKGIAASHNWELAVEYNMRQREIAAAEWDHNLDMLDQAALIQLALQATVIRAAPPAPTTLSCKRKTPGGDGTPSSMKCLASGHCFWCGGAAHMPADCVASATSARRAPAPVHKTGRNKNTLLAKNGKQYCFSFAHGSCHTARNCANFHGCSICRDTVHGAASCPWAA